MLRAQNLHETLKMGLSGGVESIVLTTTAGGVLASAHVDPAFVRTKEHSLFVAVVANVWRNYSVNDLTGPAGAAPSERKEENLEFLVLDTAGRRLCMVGLVGSAAVLCLAAAPSVEAGMLRLRATSLHGVLEPQLRGVLEPSSQHKATDDASAA
jgi:hypothetical protein